MKKYPDLKIVIEGHTDNVGGDKYNLNLSQKRAEAIKNIMVTKFNIEPSRLAAKSIRGIQTYCEQFNQGRKTEEQEG